METLCQENTCRQIKEILYHHIDQLNFYMQGQPVKVTKCEDINVDEIAPEDDNRDCYCNVCGHGRFWFQFNNQSFYVTLCKFDVYVFVIRLNGYYEFKSIKNNRVDLICLHQGVSSFIPILEN